MMEIRSREGIPGGTGSILVGNGVDSRDLSIGRWLKLRDPSPLLIEIESGALLSMGSILGAVSFGWLSETKAR